MSLVRSLGRASQSLRGFKTGLEGAGRAAKDLGQKAGSAGTGVGKVRTGSQQAARELKTLRTNADQAARSVSKAGKEAGKGGGSMGRFQGGLKNAAGGFKGLNKEMKGNVIGMLLGLLQPLIEKVVAMAAKSKTMQKIMHTAFDVIGKVIGVVMKAVGPLMRSVGRIVSSVWKGIQNAIAPVVKWIGSAVPKVFTAVKDALSNTWKGLSGIAQRAFDGIKGAVKGPLNAVIDIINSAIGKLNGIRVSIPGWVPLVGGKTFGVSLPSIPRLAEGGVVMPRSGGVPAIVAEAGEAEAVMPLSKLDRLLARTAAQARAQQAGGADGSGFHIENYYAVQSSDPRRTAAALMFLAKARG
ncbi:phage tail protein [Streptomyces sp. NPDC049577]|uniref:phage tail protein n=1 Tax=Streptomyces sp. NPDC049577 TaxID=3155153 RepID=UPI00343DB248